MSLAPDIIKRCKNGDREAFNILITEYQSKIINIAYGIMGDKEDAYDAAQETFVKIYKSIGTFQGKSSFDTWIYRVTTNMCMDLLRKKSRTIVSVSIDAAMDTGEDEVKADIPDSAPTPEEQMESSETVRLVRDAINGLSDEYRQIITLYDIEGFSYDEIVSILNIPSGTVKSRLSRARKALKKVLSENKEHFL